MAKEGISSVRLTAPRTIASRDEWVAGFHLGAGGWRVQRRLAVESKDRLLISRLLRSGETREAKSGGRAFTATSRPSVRSRATETRDTPAPGEIALDAERCVNGVPKAICGSANAGRLGEGQRTYAQTGLTARAQSEASRSSRSPRAHAWTPALPRRHPGCARSQCAGHIAARCFVAANWTRKSTQLDIGFAALKFPVPMVFSRTYAQQAERVLPV